MNKVLRITSSILFIAFIMTSCGGLKGIKVPDDKKDYVGLWKTTDISLSISEGGKVEYENKSGNVDKSISAPIQKFDGNNFTVGALGINTTFAVSAPPHKDSTGVWKMTVDGNELTKQ